MGLSGLIALVRHAPESPDRGASREPRPSRRWVLIVAVLLLGTIGLLPLFKWNLFHTADTGFFDQFDLFSESLVLAKIESTEPQAVAATIPQAGLMIAGPNAGVVYEAFNGLANGGAPGATSYMSYVSNLGLQGFLFSGAYRVGCTSIGCLETLASGLTALALLGFALLLGTITSRSFAGTFFVVAVVSPWIVAVARNLYWMPSTWFLPAIAAICYVRSTSRRQRVISLVALFACYALRFGMGFEFITTITLLAAAMPLIAFAFHRNPRTTVLGAVRQSAIVIGVGVTAFVVVVIALAFDVGSGNPTAGFEYVWADATKRTYGGNSDEPLTALSLQTPLSAVLAKYTIGWATDVVAFGKGTSAELALAPQTMWLLILLAVGVVLVRLWSRDVAGRRDLLLLGVALVLPLSWFLMAKSHSAMHTGINFVLWYMLGIGTLMWLVGRALWDALTRLAHRALLVIRDAERSQDERSASPAAISRGIVSTASPMPVKLVEARLPAAPTG